MVIAALTLSVILSVPLDAGSIRVVDGDTIQIQHTDAEPESVRIMGVDAPEMRGKCPEEKALAAAARAYLAARLFLADRIVLHPSARRDRYRRTLGWLTVDGERVDRLLIAAGLGRAYDGGKRQGWCE